MRKHLLSGAVAALSLTMATSFAMAGQTSKPAKAIKWAPSFKAAMASAKSSNKLVMVDFYTEW